MRILHIASTMDKGGIATSLWHLLPEFVADSRIHIEVIALYEVGRFGEALVAQGIPVQHLHLHSKYDLRGIINLIRLIAQERFELVHAHGWPAVLFVALASLFSRQSRFVLTEHSISNRRRRLGLKLLDQFIYSRFQQVIAVSHAAARALVAWLPSVAEKITIIHNGLSIERFSQLAHQESNIRTELGIADNVPILLSAGRLEHVKGYDLLLRAMGDLEEFTPILLIAGEGHLEFALKKLARELGLSERVRWLGLRSDLRAIMAASGVFVLASRSEGCPMVILEAMALGKPIVATAVGGIPELIADGETGWLVSPDDVPALVAALKAAIVKREHARQLGKRAREMSVQFDARQMAHQLFDVYAQCAPK